MSSTRSGRREIHTFLSVLTTFVMAHYLHIMTRCTVFQKIEFVPMQSIPHQARHGMKHGKRASKKQFLLSTDTSNTATAPQNWTEHTFTLRVFKCTTPRSRPTCWGIPPPGMPPHRPAQTGSRHPIGWPDQQCRWGLPSSSPCGRSGPEPLATDGWRRRDT